MNVPKFILAHTSIHNTKMWHFYVVLTGWASIYTTMNIAVLLFLNEILNNIFLAGLALALGSFSSMVFDGLFSSFQKIFSARSLFITSIFGMILSVLLFLAFGGAVMAFVAAIVFRVAFDLCDITAVSYVLAKSVPEQYGQNLSYKQLAQGVGMIFGLIISAVLITASSFATDITASVVDAVGVDSHFISTLFFVKVFLLVLLGVLLLFSFLLFDKETEHIDKKLILTSLKSLLHKKNVTKGKNDITLTSTEIKQKKKISFSEISSELTSAVKVFTALFKKENKKLSLLWSMGIMGIFSYWDTFLATFLPLFFTQVLQQQTGWLQNVPGSILLLIFILPVLGLLPLVAKMADAYGRRYFMVLGVVITAIATAIAGIVPMTAFWILMMAGFGIAFGYLFGMSSAKAETAFQLNESIARIQKKKEIDTNASAGPMMIIDNLGNIIGPVLGGLMIEYMDFQNFFLVFSVLMVVLLLYTAIHKKEILEK